MTDKLEASDKLFLAGGLIVSAFCIGLLTGAQSMIPERHERIAQMNGVYGTDSDNDGIDDAFELLAIRYYPNDKVKTLADINHTTDLDGDGYLLIEEWLMRQVPHQCYIPKVMPQECYWRASPTWANWEGYVRPFCAPVCDDPCKRHLATCPYDFTGI